MGRRCTPAGRPTPAPWADAITHFARALGAARSGQPDAARPDLDRLIAIREALKQAKNDYWAEQVDIQWRASSAWTAYASGNKDEALKVLREAATMEDATEKAAGRPELRTARKSAKPSL